MPDRKLGKLPPRHDKRVPMLAKYTAGLGVKAPADRNWAAKLTHLGMMKNDTLGDCTCAAAGHLVQLWTANAGSQVIVSDAEVVSMYERSCGYKPGDANTDQGGVETDVLTWWLNNPLGGHKLDGFAAIEPRNPEDIKDSIWLFGGSYLGLALPLSCQDQDVWAVPPGGPVGDGAPGSWGGHAVPAIAYDARGVTVITWGQLKIVTWGFLAAYLDEAYAPLSMLWIKARDLISPSGFHFTSLERDMGVLRA